MKPTRHIARYYRELSKEDDKRYREEQIDRCELGDEEFEEREFEESTFVEHNRDLTDIFHD